MPIKLQCPECKTVSVAPGGRAGQHVRCKRCHTKFPIPLGAPTLPVVAGTASRAPVLPESPQVIDRYEVRELLGSGSYGSVYRAFDPRLKREVALKVLRREMTSSPQAVERFLREAEAAAKLDHPHIVAVFDAGRAGDVYFIASAFIKGGTLASAVPPEGMELRRAVELTAQLASALGYAHRQGVVHRDVKPANALLDEYGSLRLMDFGLAGWTQDECTRLTRQGAVMGTPAYMAPEQASGATAEIGPASDLYSAGVVLYELLTGRRPFGGDNAASMMYQIIHTAAPPPSDHRPGLDAALEATCLKAIAKKPADRFENGEKMAAALRAWTPAATLVAEPLATYAPVGLPAEVWEWVTETVGVQSGRPDELPSAASITLGKQSPLTTILEKRFGPKWKLWACVSLTILIGLAGAMVAVCLAPPRTGAVQAERPKSDPAPAGKELQDEIVNAFGMRLKLIKPGRFLMGSPDDEPGAEADEHPQHRVEITRSFYLGAYQVTQAEYVSVTGLKNPSWFSNEGGGRNDSHLEGRDTSKFPVQNVDWEGAAEFCKELNRRDAKRPAGWKYTLPTEAEWEYACRAGTTPAYFFGDKDLRDYAWYDGNCADPHAVGTRKPNPWGLYDMNGNVWQWCADWYDKDYYASSPNKDPQGPQVGLYRVLRGGSWGTDAGHCRAAVRFKHVLVRFHYSYGFRVCLRQE